LATKIFSIKKYDAVFGPQEVVVIATILSSTFGNSIFYGLEGIEQLMISVEQSTLSLLATYIFQRSITLALMAFDLKSAGCCYLILASTCLTALSLAWVAYVTVRVSVELGRHMIHYQFFNYHQMHDFWRMIAVLLYIGYNVVICIRFGGELSGFSCYYTLESHTAIAILVGQVGLIMLLILIDSRSLLRRAELTEEKLQVRLDLVRYLSHEMRSPLNTAFMGLQLMYHDAVSVLAFLKASAPTLAALLDFRDGDGVDINPMLDPLSKMQAIIETNALVQESSHLALETLNDMLTFDKLGEKKLVLELKDVDVWSFVQETVRPFVINATMRSTAISMRCMDEASMWTDKYRIRADKFKLSQVIRNFMSNALKFARSTGGAVEVIVEKIVSPQSKVIHTANAVPMVRVCAQEFVRVSVVDNGCGISIENQRKLFGQYVQFNASELQKGGGSGLGLWISKSTCSSLLSDTSILLM
jgi:signal transduction histidine kinase